MGVGAETGCVFRESHKSATKQNWAEERTVLSRAGRGWGRPWRKEQRQRGAGPRQGGFLP